MTPAACISEYRNAPPAPSERMVAYRDLPEDMQQLITDYACSDEGADLDALESHEFKVHDVPTNLFPSPGVDGGSRNEEYALSIPLDDYHPVVLVGNHFIDGKHRVFKCNAAGAKTISSINLNEIGVIFADGHMGLLKEPFFREKGMRP